MADAPLDALAKVPLFAELGERELKLLSGQMHERRFPAGRQACAPAASVVRKASRDSSPLVPDLWFTIIHGASV